MKDTRERTETLPSSIGCAQIAKNISANELRRERKRKLTQDTKISAKTGKHRKRARTSDAASKNEAMSREKGSSVSASFAACGAAKPAGGGGGSLSKKAVGCAVCAEEHGFDTRDRATMTTMMSLANQQSRPSNGGSKKKKNALPNGVATLAAAHHHHHHPPQQNGGIPNGKGAPSKGARSGSRQQQAQPSSGDAPSSGGASATTTTTAAAPATSTAGTNGHMNGGAAPGGKREEEEKFKKRSRGGSTTGKSGQQQQHQADGGVPGGSSSSAGGANPATNGAAEKARGGGGQSSHGAKGGSASHFHSHSHSHGKHGHGHAHNNTCLLQNFFLELDNMIAGVTSDDPQRQLEATTQFRKLLSIEKNPPIAEVIATGQVPRFISFLSRDSHPKLQFEAAWTLTNIASGTSEQTRVVVEKGAITQFVRLLSSPVEDVQEQAVWGLGNIAGDSPQCRDLVLQEPGALDSLLRILSESRKLSVLRVATWTLSTLCRNDLEQRPPFELLPRVLPTLARLINESTDVEILGDACWALAYLSDGTNDRIQAVVDAGICKRMVDLLLHGSYSVKEPALRTIGNIVTGEDHQTQAVIDASVLPCLLYLLNDSKKELKKETCWTLSNITAGTEGQIQAVIEAQLMPPLINSFNNAGYDVEIKKEAAMAIVNAMGCGSPSQIRYMVQHGCFKPLAELLVSNDNSVIIAALEALENILKVGKADGYATGRNAYVDLIEEVDGFEKIQQLQAHPDINIHKKAVKILETYFGAHLCNITSIEDELEHSGSSSSSSPSPSLGSHTNHPLSFGSNLLECFNFG